MSMRNMRFIKNAAKRIGAFALALVTAVSVMPIHRVQAEKKTVVNADVSSSVQRAVDAGLKNNVNSDSVIRAVLDDIEELPQYGNSNFTSLERGSVERPFVILEIVPAEECGEYGYLVSGCEPVRTEDMFGGSLLTSIASMNTCDVRQISENTYFFEDEKEGQRKYYNNFSESDWNYRVKEACRTELSHNGYYEYVGDGSGCFDLVDADTLTMKKTAVGEGAYIWHTVNSFEASDYSGVVFDGTMADTEAVKGARIYTTRTSSNTDKVVNVAQYYYSYKNREMFLTDTLIMSQEAASRYSCVIKTITADELNSTPDWIDYADLIYIFPGNHMDAVINIWKSDVAGETANRLGHTSAVTSYPLNSFEINDISAAAALKIFDRVSATNNFASIIIDNRLYDLNQNTYTSASKANTSAVMNVYDWNLRDTGKDYTIPGGTCKNNVYKMCMMLISLNPNLVKQLYLQPGNEIIKDMNGTLVDTLHDGIAAEYWSGYTLQLVDRTYTGDVYSYSTRYDNWTATGSCGNPSSQNFKTFVSDHIYTYNGNSSVAMNFVGGLIGSDKQTNTWGGTDYIYSDFREHLADTADRTGYDESVGADSSDAVRYILGVAGKNPYFGDDRTLKILDIEPGVGLDTSSRPDWVLTASYIRKLLPDFAGKIEITHQTTAEFVGRIEDLNSEYNLIYVGLDTGAFNTKNNAQVTLNNGSSSWGNTITDFNDNSLDGKIYFHIGDKMVSACYKGDNRNRSMKFLYNVSTGSVVNSEELRFPGNDITNIKKQELISYIESGRPIVTEQYLYNLEKFFIDENSNIYSLVNSYRNTEDSINGIFVSTDSRIRSIVRNQVQGVTFTAMPALYNGNTVSSSNPTISNPNYLPTNSDGNAYMEFRFNVVDAGYNYRIYVDQDKDSKFTASEVVKEGVASVGGNICTYDVASSIVGVVQWKIEVYRLDNSNIRYTQTGSSAVRIRSTDEKKQLKVLQIMPKNDGGLLNLQNDTLFKDRYSSLNDFEVTVRTITWADFEKFFAGSGFTFDLSADISSTNPDSEALAAASDEYDAYGRVIKSELDGKKIGKLSAYNMIIVGFGDCYGSVDLSNDNGAVEYLQYYTKLGKSILYTHDITSMYNLKDLSGRKVFGYTANAMLRDIIGMNRYKAVSSELSTAMRDALIRYQSTGTYDDIALAEKQGFTYYTMKRLGWTNASYNANSGNKLPYRYMITNPQGNAVVTENYTSQTTGFANTNDITTTATKVNEGQVTTYPYTISDVLPIAATHGQWYQLNMEDPEVTVWYCLSDPLASGNSGTGSARSTSSAENGDGSALTYGVSPNDVANNYYIYSKGNIFYSGVGHSRVNGDMEAKLFVNTMIAAYRLSYDAPTVKIEKAELTAETGSSMNSAYDLNVDKLSGNDYSSDVPDEYADYVRIYFRPEDMSFSNNIDVRISYAKKDGTRGYISEIWTAEADADEVSGTVHVAGADNYFGALKNNKLYYYYYPKSDIRNVGNTFMHEVNNNRSSDVGLTYLRMNLQTLYYLD